MFVKAFLLKYQVRKYQVAGFDRGVSRVNGSCLALCLIGIIG